MIEYLRYSILEILSTVHGLNTVTTLQYPWYSIHMTVSTLKYPWYSINFTVSTVKYPLYSSHNSEEQRQWRQHSLPSITLAKHLYCTGVVSSFRNLPELPPFWCELTDEVFVCCFSWLQYTGVKLWVLAVPTIRWLYFHFTPRGECVTRLHLESIFTVTILD